MQGGKDKYTHNHTASSSVVRLVQSERYRVPWRHRKLKKKKDLLTRIWGRIVQASWRGLFIQQIHLRTLSGRIDGK